jgi:hypothetical protein
MQTIADSQKSAEVPINDNFANVLWAELFARNPVTSSGLTWGYKGGQWPVNGLPTAIADGTITLTANATNYIGVTQAGVVAVATTSNPLHAPLFTVVAGASTVTSWTDTRNAAQLVQHAYGIASLAVTAANVTLTQAQALCDSLVITGTLTAARNVIVPLVRRRWTVRHTGTAFAIQVIGATGTGITIAVGKVAVVECDGTNVLRVTADA